MGHEDLIREVVERVSEWVRDGLAAELSHLVDEVGGQVRAAVEAELRTGFEQEMAARIAATRAEAERAASERLEATLAARLAELEAEAEERVRTVRAEAERILAAELEQARRDADEQLAAALATARADAAAAVLASVDRLVEAIRRLDTARGLSDVLALVADGAAAEAARVAVFLVQGARLRGWRLVGFGPTAPDARSVDLTLSEAGPIGRAVETESVVALAGPATLLEPHVPAFSSLEAGDTAVAVPISVGRRVVAVLYADDVGRRAEKGSPVWPKAVEVLARHAGRSLEALTAWQTAQVMTRTVPPSGSAATLDATSRRGATTAPVRAEAEGGSAASADQDDGSARRYARLLVSEIRLYHEADVRRGREERDLLRRLAPAIERARRLYEQRVPAEIRARTSYFEQELVRTLADGDPTLLGEAR